MKERRGKKLDPDPKQYYCHVIAASNDVSTGVMIDEPLFKKTFGDETFADFCIFSDRWGNNDETEEIIELRKKLSSAIGMDPAEFIKRGRLTKKVRPMSDS